MVSQCTKYEEAFYKPSPAKGRVGSEVCVQLLTSADNVALPAFAAAGRAAARLLLSAWRPPLSIDISCRHGAQQQTRRTWRLRRMMGRTDTDRRTDGRTDA